MPEIYPVNEHLNLFVWGLVGEGAIGGLRVNAQPAQPAWGHFYKPLGAGEPLKGTELELDAKLAPGDAGSRRGSITYVVYQVRVDAADEPDARLGLVSYGPYEADFDPGQTSAPLVTTISLV